LENKANINALDNVNQTSSTYLGKIFAYYDGADLKKWEMFKLMLEKKSDLNLCVKNETHPLFTCKRNFDLFHLILQNVVENLKNFNLDLVFIGEKIINT
jgi:hypothetical protein